MSERIARNIPKSRQELLNRLGTAIESHPSPDGEPINEEHLAMLCEGEIDALSADDRERLLRQIAAEPWGAELVKELRDDGWGPQANFSIGTAVLRAAPWAWAAAASVVICLGVWRMARPPATPTSIGTNIIQSPGHPPKQDGSSIPNPTNVTNEHSGTKEGHIVDILPTTQSVNSQENWNVKDVTPTLPPENLPAGHSVRDLLLLTAGIALLLLTIPAVWWVAVRRQLRTIEIQPSRRSA